MFTSHRIRNPQAYFCQLQQCPQPCGFGVNYATTQRSDSVVSAAFVIKMWIGPLV